MSKNEISLTPFPFLITNTKKCIGFHISRSKLKHHKYALSEQTNKKKKHKKKKQL